MPDALLPATLNHKPGFRLSAQDAGNPRMAAARKSLKEPDWTWVWAIKHSGAPGFWGLRTKTNETENSA